MKFETISYKKNRLEIIDQRELPFKFKRIEAVSVKDVYYYIKTLAVRGAPAIGVFAAYGVLVGINGIKENDKKIFFDRLNSIIDYLKKSRPTAVNLFWALDRMRDTALRNSRKSLDAIKRALGNEARAIHSQDQRICESMAINGARLIKKNDTILTHCNAGMLATSGLGTALGVIYKAHQQGKNIKVFADETRPLLQGARLTTLELYKNGIDITLICDNMAAVIMSQGRVDKVIVGADRIAANGDTANKIGTYSLAIAAKAHNIPFYVAAPISTLDLSIKHGSLIPIEERPPDEIKNISGTGICLKNIKAYNPAFDVTPACYISAIITEKGIFKKPYTKSLKI